MQVGHYTHALISNVTEAVEAERKAWQNRSLDAVYPIVFLDALRVKVRHEGRVIVNAPFLQPKVRNPVHKVLSFDTPAQI